MSNKKSTIIDFIDMVRKIKQIKDVKTQRQVAEILEMTQQNVTRYVKSKGKKKSFPKAQIRDFCDREKINYDSFITEKFDINKIPIKSMEAKTYDFGFLNKNALEIKFEYILDKGKPEQVNEVRKRIEQIYDEIIAEKGIE